MVSGCRIVRVPGSVHVVSWLLNPKGMSEAVTVRFDSVTEAEYAAVSRAGEEPVPEFLIEVLVSMYRAVDNGEFARATDAIERITGAAAETAEEYLRRTIVR